MSSSSTAEVEGEGSPLSSTGEVEQEPTTATTTTEGIDVLDGGIGGMAEGEEDEDESRSYHSSESISSEEIDALLDEDYRKKVKPKEYSVKEIVVLEEKGKNTLEGLPGGWIEVRHCSGMPLYLHRKSRVCSLSKPYNLGPASARRHPIPLSAIPCLAYSKALQREKEQLEAATLPPAEVVKVVASTDNGEDGQGEGEVGACPVAGNSGDIAKIGDMVRNPFTFAPLAKRMRYDGKRKEVMLPRAKVETAIENTMQNSIEPLALREYCQKLFKFKRLSCKRFKSWGERRKHNKNQKRMQLTRPSLPDGVKLITFPVYTQADGDGGSKVNKEYIMNPQGKSSVCILHEYVQHALRLQPTYEFKELENAATPYAAIVEINGLKYGTGYGSSKKQAKANAARQTLEILIPAMRDQLDGPDTEKTNDIDPTLYFDQMELDDPRITSMCQNMSEPSPYTLLLTCLQRNRGKEEYKQPEFNIQPSTSKNGQSNKFVMEARGFSVEVAATNKKEGKQLASQAILAKIHPHIKNFGSFLRLYGNGSIKTIKEKKKDEQQITTLQSKASANSPNYAILAKLREEMRKLNHFPKSPSDSQSDITEVNTPPELQSSNVGVDQSTNGNTHSTSAEDVVAATNSALHPNPMSAEVSVPKPLDHEPISAKVATLAPSYREPEPKTTEVAPEHEQRSIADLEPAGSEVPSTSEPMRKGYPDPEPMSIDSGQHTQLMANAVAANPNSQLPLVS